MGQTDRAVAYREAFDSARSQLDRLIQEMERMKDRQEIVERAAKALEPVIAPDAAHRSDSYLTAAAADVPHSSQQPEIHKGDNPLEVMPQTYVHGHGELKEEMDRRINFALGRTAAD